MLARVVLGSMFSSAAITLIYSLYGNRKNSAEGAGIYYAGVWQELVLDESHGLLDWAKSIIE